MSAVSERLRAALADRYAIEREIGSGGMATVYLAEDLKHHRKVAVKVLRPDLAAALGPERFLREIEIAASLTHPNVLTLIDSGQADGFLYYVMPFVEGESLRARLAREGELPVSEAVRLLRDIVDALTAAHARGIVHRDIKPDNVLLAGKHAMVTDFGVAKAVSEATGRQALTTAGVALGTPAYMAPEQAAADPHIDHRADIYAVGAVAYELLAGRPPFTGSTPQAVLAAHVTEAPAAVSQHRAAVPPALEAVVMQCLAKRPADRWQSADELLAQLEALATPSGPITPTDTRPLTGVAAVRRRPRAVVAAVAAVAVIGAGAVALWPRGATGLDPDRVVVAILDNQTGDPALEPVGRMAADWVTQGIAQAGIVNVVSATAVLEATRGAGAAGERLEGTALARAVARENGARLLVSGTYFRFGDSLRIQAEITDAGSGALLSAIEPVTGSVASPVEAAEVLRQRVLGALATLMDPRLADYATAASKPPKYEAYREFIEGLEHYIRADYLPAIERFRRAAELDTTYMYPVLQAAAAYSNLGRYAESDSLTQIAIRHRDRLTRYDALYLDSHVAGLRGDWMARLQAWRQRVELAPGSGRDLYAVGWAANAVNRPAEALAALRRIDPDVGWVKGWAAYWGQLAVAYHYMGRFDNELDAAREGVSRHPGLLALVSAEFRALAARGRVPELERRVGAVLAMPPAGTWTPAWLLQLAAGELAAHGHPEPAVRLFAHAVAWYEARPADKDTLNQRRHALALLGAGKPNDALRRAEQLVGARPRNRWDLGVYGIALAASGRAEEARAAADRLAAIDEPYLFGGPTRDRARIAALLGERERAVQLLRDALAEGDSFDSGYHADPTLRSLWDYPPYRELLRPKG